MSACTWKLRVAHLTSVHPRYDTRIFIKQCCSLVRQGYDVSLVVADGRGDELQKGVKIIDVGCPKGRFDRVMRTTRRVLNKAISLDADLFHLHDPELIIAGLYLKRLGKKVVFDSHEDVPRQILGKPYLPQPFRRALSMAMDRFERFACPRLDGVIAATPYIRDKFVALGARSVDINNFPIMDELAVTLPWSEKKLEVSYIGGLEATRGIREIIRACELLHSSARLNMAGRFTDPELEKEMKGRPGWGRVNPLGYLDRAGVRETLAHSMAGLVTLHPIVNYFDALPVKMFEYMAAGIPVIASDFPLWREIVMSNECGVCIDPLDPAAIAEAIDYLVTHPDVASRMGMNGRAAVAARYNWANEEQKMLAFYASITGNG